MNTATHPLQLDGAPRRQFLVGTLWLPMLGTFTFTAVATAISIWVIVTQEGGQPFASAQVMDWVLVVGVAIGAIVMLSAARCRKQAWWSVNPTVADRGQVPRWIEAAQSLIALTPLVAGATVVATHPGLLGSILGVMLTTLWVGLLLLPRVCDFGIRVAARLSSGVKATAPRRHLRLWEAIGGLVVVATMWAVPAAAGSPLWAHLAASLAQHSVVLALAIAVVCTFVTEFVRGAREQARTASSETVPA